MLASHRDRMTDTQLYLAVGLPIFAIMMSTVVGMLQSNALSTNMNARFTSMENRFTVLESRFSGLESRFEILTGKVVEMANRLTRLETLLERR